METSSPSIRELFNLTGRTAVITGGAGLLGIQHALTLAELGATVEIWDRDGESLKSACDYINSKFPESTTGYMLDIVDPQTVKRRFDFLDDKWGGLNILINNAGLTVGKAKESAAQYFSRFESYSLQMWESALNVNLTGTFIVTQSAFPLLKKRAFQASVINIASDVGVISPDHRIYEPNPITGYQGVSFNSPLSYAMTKSALIHMAKYLATYWARDGIRINSLCPAGVETKHDPGFVQELAARIPLGRMAKSWEYKGAIAFLASDASTFMTGSNLIVDGGRTAW